MGKGCVHSCGYVLIVMVVVALLFGLIALGIPYWYKSDVTYSTGAAGGSVESITREGLWKTCTDLEYTSDSSSYCVDNEATTAITGLRWTLLVSSGILGIACLAAGAAHMEQNRTAFVVTAVHAIIAGICKLAVAAIYATVVKDDLGFKTSNLYAGWGLAVLAGLLSLLAAILSFILARCVTPAKVANGEGKEKSKAEADKDMNF